MKAMARKRIVVLCLLAGARVSFSADWVPQESGTQSTLAAVHFVDTEVGYAVGFLAVLKTLDGGATWQSMDEPASVAFTSVYAKSATDVFVGRQSLYHSVDGGVTWREFDQFPEAPLGSILDIKFTSETTGFLVKFGKVFRTLNGGDTWTAVFSEPGLFLSEIDTPDPETIYVAGGITYEPGSFADFIRSYDGGDTWEVVPQPALDEILASAWVGPRQGYVFTFSQQVLQTLDGGDSWMPVGDWIGEMALDADFADAEDGFAVCYSGNVLATTDGGLTWTTTRASPGPLSALARPCGGMCYAVGNGGRIFKRMPDAEAPEELRIRACTYSAADGTITLSFHSSPCRRQRIEVSHDLRTWAQAAEWVPETMDWQLTVGATGHPSSFYRVADVHPRTTARRSRH